MFGAVTQHNHTDRIVVEGQEVDQHKRAGNKRYGQKWQRPGRSTFAEYEEFLLIK